MLSPLSRVTAFVLFGLPFFLVGVPIAASDNWLDENFSDQEVDVMEAYIAFYGRPPEPAGLVYWSDRLVQAGGELNVIIAAFGHSAEYIERFGHLNNADLIRNLYRQLFDREPDGEGLAFYLDQLETGLMDPPSLALHVYKGAQNDDLEALENKLAAAGHFVTEVGQSGLEIPVDAAALAELLTGVTSSAISLTAWYATIEGLVAGWLSGLVDAFSSDQELAEYLKTGLVEGVNIDYFRPFDILIEDTAPGDIDTRNGKTELFSQTTLQESGVDEADRVKTDGRYLYVVSDNHDLVYIDGDTRDMGGASLPDVRVMEMTDEPPSSAEIASIDFEQLDGPIDGLYLVTDRPSDQPDLLVVVGGTGTAFSWASWPVPWLWSDARTELSFVNVDVPSSPQIMKTIQLDGHLIASRRIAETLYLVTRYTPSLDGYDPYPLSDADGQHNLDVLAEAGPEELMPRYSIDRMDKGTFVKGVTTLLPAADENRLAQSTLVSITAIDLADPDRLYSTSIAGPTETVYVGTESLYLATSRQEYLIPIEPAPIDVAQHYPQETDLHKFSLRDGAPSYRASGTVIGHLGWEPAKKPFRMGEYDNILRIATSVGNDWDGSASTRLTLLQEDSSEAGGLLRELAHLDHIGKEGERLYASRFIGNRAYLVTFRVTDPLYLFDLSDPTRIEILGELEIAGYSDYLFPVGEDLLLGIGKDAIPDTSSSDFGGRGAWYQGVKIALFDVSGAGSELDSIIVGRRGTESGALYGHHGLTMLPMLEEGIVRLAMPISLHDSADESIDADPWTYYPWTHTGLYLYEINLLDGQAGIDTRGHIIVADDNSLPSQPHGLANDRSVMTDHAVHYIHDGLVWSSYWGDTDNPHGPE